ncbi:MAG: MFS transporter [Candidatus Thermoplasmatota archaeon]|nr:MFS transporter [Candidatus Thermoplasmatota archaeon]
MRNSKSPMPRSLLAISFADLIRGFTRYPLWILLSIYLLQSRRLSYIDIGIFFLLQSVITVPFSLVLGKHMDIHGRRKLAIVLPAILTFAFVGLFVCVWMNLPIFMLFAAMVSTTILSQIQYNLYNAILTDLSTESARVGFFSTVRVFSNAGIGIGLILSGLTSLVSPSLYFIAPIIGSVAEVFIVFRYIPETFHGDGRKAAKHERKNRISNVRILFVVSMILALSALVSNMYESPMLPLYLTSRYHYSTFLITGLYAVNTIIVILLQFRINSLGKRFGEVTAYSMGLILYALSDIVFGLTGAFALLVLNVVMLTVGENMTAQFSQVFISRLAPEEMRGRYFGFSSAVFSFIFPLSPFLGTGLLELFHGTPLLLWGIIAGMCFLMAIISRLLGKIIPAPGVAAEGNDS